LKRHGFEYLLVIFYQEYGGVIELNYLTEDDLPSEIPSSDVVLREIEEFLRQSARPSPNSGSGDPSDSA